MMLVGVLRAQYTRQECGTGAMLRSRLGQRFSIAFEAVQLPETWTHMLITPVYRGPRHLTFCECS